MRVPCIVVPAVVLALLSTAPPATAQQLGVKGGLNVGGVDNQLDRALGPFPFTLDGRNGVTVGVLGVFPVTSRVAVQAEALYSRRRLHVGLNSMVPTLGGSDLLTFAPVDLELEADYIELPLLLRLSTGAPIGLYGIVGPSLAVNLGATLQDEFFAPSVEQDVGGAIEDFELALVIGGGVELGSRFLIDGRYRAGLTDVVDLSAGPLGVPTIEWREVALTLGVLF